MIIKNIENIKGFMPSHEGEALYKWANKFCHKGPVIEIGTYCGKSTIYLTMARLRPMRWFIQLIIMVARKNIN